MKQEPGKKSTVNKDIDVSRSEHQQAQKAAGENPSGEEQRAEGSKYKGNPQHQHGSHGEGQYTRQSDDPTMHPSDADDEK
jgi:hypothetical protein